MHGLQQVMGNVQQATQLIGRSGSVSQIDATCAALRQAANRTPDALLAATFHALRGMTLAAKLGKTAEISDLEAAVNAFEQAVDTAPESNPIRAVYQEQLAKLRNATAEAAEEDERMERVRHVSLDGSERIDAALQARDPVALTAGIELLREALDLMPDGDELRPAILTDIGIALRHRFELTRSAADLDTAVETQQQAVDAAAPDTSRRPFYLHNLATSRRMRFEHGGVPADLDAADEASQQAIALCAADDPRRASILSERGLALFDMHRHTGSLDRLDESIAVSRQAVDAAADTPTRVKCLANLGVVAAFRFETLRDTVDANAAVKATGQALDAVGPDDPDRAAYLALYASALRLRGERTGSLADVSAAVDNDQQAVAASGPGDYLRAMRISHLGTSLLRRHELTGAPADLNAAVEAGHGSVAAAADDDPFRPLCFSNLSLSLLRRFQRDGALTDLNASVRACEQACAAAPGADPGRPRYLANLANALEARFDRLTALDDLDRAIDTAREAATFPTAAPNVRARVAITWGHLAARAERWAEAVRAYRTAIDLLEKVAPRGLARSDQEYELIAITGVGSRAAACCLELGDVELAVELLEHGRGVLLSQAIATRTNLTALAQHHPDVAERFIGLRDALDAAPGPPISDTLRDLTAERRRRLAEDLDGVIAQARALPGFEKFLVPLTEGELRQAAGEGPVVLINVDEIRSDALLLTPDRVRHVALPALSATNVREQVVEFLRALGELPDSAGSTLAVPSEERLSAVLGWLWDTVADPVLDELGLAGKPAADQPWPRIWWCPTGLLSLVPLHAAGYHGTHRDATPRTVIDRVVSSYTPTVRALRHSRRPAGPATADAARLLVVGASQVAGAPELVYAAREVDFLRNRFGADATVLEGRDGADAASYENVHDALPRFPWAHFACHAMSRLDDPSASHLVLPPDQGGRELSVTDIGRLNLERAELAFLSACSTAQTGLTLPDEAINLAAGFQLAGYRRVVATMWPVDDRLAERIAKGCYENLASTGTAQTAAQLLHEATRTVRLTRTDQPSLWAGHIHSGC